MKKQVVVCMLAVSARAAENHKADPGALASDLRRGSWWEEVRHNIAEAQLEIQIKPDFSSRAVSIDADFQTTFVQNGMEVSPRHATAESRGDGTGLWSVRYEFMAARFADRWLSSGGPVSHGTSSKRVRFERGEIVEVYDNTSRGVEQKFILPVPPIGWAGRAPSADSDLVVEGRFTTSLMARRVPGQGIVFSDGTLDRMRYTEPVVSDAAGRVAAAQLRVAARPDQRGWDTEIRVASTWLEDATYPVTIDPVSTLPDWLPLSGQSFDRLGTSVSTAGDVNRDGYSDVIVGVPYCDSGQMDEGCANVYYGGPSGLPTTPSVILQSDQPGTQFGKLVGSAGDVNCDRYSDVVVVAQEYTLPPAGPKSMIFVYHGSSGGLSTVPAWAVQSTTSTSADGFGWSVSQADVNGDQCSDLAVGAPSILSPSGSVGAVFVWYGAAAGLGPAWPSVDISTSADWTGFLADPPPNSSVRYGASVAGTGDYDGDGWDDLAVGAPEWNNTMPPTSLGGKVFVYRGSSSGLPPPPGMGLPPPPDWTAISDRSNGFFGWSVSTAGDVDGNGCADIVVGEPGQDSVPNGRVTVFYGCDLAVNSTVDGMDIDDLFGWSVSTAGDVNGDGRADIIVGAPGSNLGGTDRGRAFVYEGSASGLSDMPIWVGQGGASYDLYGKSVFCAGDITGDGRSDVIVGAPQDGGLPGGYARAYYGRPAGLSASPAWTLDHTQAGAGFGWSVAAAGDLNGDGYGDVAVGAYQYDNGEINEGAVFVYHGSSTGLPTTADWNAESNQALAEFGFSVASAGDVNHDGYSDLIVGAPDYDNATSNSGRAFVFQSTGVGSLNPACNNGATPAIDCATWTIGADETCGHLGFSVAGAGDVDGNGATEVLIGAPGIHDAEGHDTGRVVAFCGVPGTGLTCNTSLDPPCSCFSRLGPMGSSTMGRSVASAGDVNRDGFSDIIVGAIGCGAANAGRAYVYHGSSGGLPGGTGDSWHADGDQADEWFGESVASGDVNGDGSSDVIVGAPKYDGPEPDEGRVFVWYGSPAPNGLGPTGTPSNAAWSYQNNSPTAQLGSRVASGGDVDGDADTEVLVGAPYFDATPDGNQGRAYLFYGPLGTGTWTVTGDVTNAYLGRGLAATDVTGDGYDDVIVSAPWRSPGGRAAVYYGNPTGTMGTTAGLSVASQQLRPVTFEPMQLLGESPSGSQVALSLFALRPFVIMPVEDEGSMASRPA